MCIRDRVVTSKEVVETINTYQQMQVGADTGDIDTLLNSIRLSENSDTRSLEIVSEMINETGDDRSHLSTNDKTILIVEDDLRFAKILIDKSHEKGLKAVVATNYLEVFDFINRFSPIALTLDVKLPETSGWKVIDLLRNDLTYRHIPIHVISGEENRALALKRGARSFLLKPLDNDILNELFHDIVTYGSKVKKSILVVEDNEIDSSQIAKIHREDLLDVTIAATGK